MAYDARRWLGLGLLVGIGLFSVLFFFQTRDPMILIFGIIGSSVVYMVVNRRLGAGAGRVEVRLKCTACGELNLEDAEFCSGCGRAL